MINYNFHTHSKFSDGSAEPEAYIKEAIRQQFKGLGFTEHSSLPFDNTFALRVGNEKAYCDEINRLKEEYKGIIEVFLALEADYIPGHSKSFSELKNSLGLDYMIGSVHLVKGHSSDSELWFIDGPKVETYDEGIKEVFNGEIKTAITSYWHQVNSMIESEEFDIVGHLDKIKMHNKGRWFNESDTWYTTLIDETIDLIKQKDLVVEVNTRGIYKGRSDSLFPGNNVLHKLARKGIRVMLNSDAHQPDEISLYFKEAIETLKKCGYNSVWIFETSGLRAIPLSNFPS